MSLLCLYVLFFLKSGALSNIPVVLPLVKLFDIWFWELMVGRLGGKKKKKLFVPSILVFLSVEFGALLWGI
jgi:hypothetical protein